MVEIKIDVNSGTTADHRQGRIIVRGYFRNLGTRAQRIAPNDVNYSLRGPDGPVEVRNDAPHAIWPGLEVAPFAKAEFEAELIAYAPPELEPGQVYRLTAVLPDNSDQDTSMFTFRQMYLGGVPAGAAAGAAS